MAKALGTALAALALVVRPCFATDLGGTVTGQVTLPAGDHHVTSALTVAASGSLVLQPGARLLVDGNYGISVYGLLRADGTAASPCAVKAASDTTGAWPGFYALAAGRVLLTRTTVSHAQTGITANAAEVSLTDSRVEKCSLDGLAAYNASSVQVQSGEFAYIGRRGLFLETTGITGSVGACAFQQIGEYPIVVKATLVELLQGPFTVSGAALPYVGVSCSADEDVKDTDTWPWLGLDYDLAAGSSDELLVAPSGRLILAAGVRLRCDRVRVEGKLEADGTGAVVYLYGPGGQGGAAGDWHGIEVAGGTLTLKATSIANADTAVTADGGTVTLTGCWLDYSRWDGLWATGSTRLEMDGTQVRGAGRSGLRLVSSGLQGQVTNCALRDCAEWPVYAVPNAVRLLGAGLTFDNVGIPAIGVNCALATDIVTDQTWQPQPLPYDLAADPAALVVAVPVNRTLRLAPGVQVVNGGLSVRGRLEAEGTAEAPVVFSSSRTPPTPGECPGLAFYPGATGYVKNATVEYAATGISVTDCSPRLESVRLHRNSADGLLVSGAGATPVVYRCFLRDNGRYGVNITKGANPRLGNVGNAASDDDGLNELWGNAGPYDLYNDSASAIKAESNWWGTAVEAALAARIRDRNDYAAAGPVDYVPFRTGPANTAPELLWVGTTGYVNCGVAPLVGTPATSLVFRVRYRDAEGNPPAYVYVHILRGGEEIPGSPLALSVQGTSPDYRTGATFTRSTTLPSGRDYSYRFEAGDWQLPATGEPTEERAGPMVTTAPELFWTGEVGYENDGLEPAAGFADDTVFEYRVAYRDADGDLPTAVFVQVTLDGKPVAGSPFEMERVSGSPTAGLIYRRRQVLDQASTDGYRYSFTASDGLLAATGAPTSKRVGPEVSYRPSLRYAGEVGYEADGVEPQAAEAGSDFRFRVVYQHRGGKAPAPIRVRVADSGAEIAGSPFAMTAADAAPITEGRTYRATVALQQGRNYTHWFTATDGSFDAFGQPTQPAAGPFADRAPRLTYPTSEPCQSDGLDPNSGGSGATEFLWRVVYRDEDGDPPAFVMLRLCRDGAEVPGSPFPMQPLVGGDYSGGSVSASAGKTYEIRKRLTVLGRWKYSFVASDGCLPATGAATQQRAGPDLAGAFELTYPDLGGLEDDGLYPNQGRPGQTPFTFAIVYRHAEGKPPKRLQLKLRREHATDDVLQYNLQAMDAVAFEQGRTYERTLGLEQGNYSYWFEATDGTYVARTDELDGPALNHRPVLAWVGEGGWTTDGVDPDSGQAGKTLFSFRVGYSDADGDRPTKARLYLYTTSEVYPFWVRDMVPEADGDVREGVVYAFQTGLPYSDQGYDYRFVFDDGWGEAEGAPVGVREGPTVQPAAPSALVLSAVMARAGRSLATVECRVTSPNCTLSGWVLNLAGRRIARLAAGSVNPSTGRAALCWNYTNLHGAAVPAGNYLVVVEARAPSGDQCRRVVPLAVRR